MAIDISEFKPTLHSDLSLADKDIYDMHKSFVDAGNYTQASTLLKNSPQVHGGVASMLNEWESRILKLAKDILYYPYYRSQTEPTVEQMQDSIIWEQEY